MLVMILLLLPEVVIVYQCPWHVLILLLFLGHLFDLIQTGSEVNLIDGARSVTFSRLLERLQVVLLVMRNSLTLSPNIAHHDD